MTRIRFLLCLLALSICFASADANEIVSSFIPASESGQSGEGQTGVEVSSIVIKDGPSVSDAVEYVAEVIRDAREDNPELGAVQILEIGRDGIAKPRIDVSASEVVIRLREAIPRIESAVAIPDDGLQEKIESIDAYFFENHARSEISKTRISLSILRSFLVGSVTMVALVVQQLPVPAVIAGVVAAAYISGRLQYIDDHLKTWATGRAFWDPKDHRNSPKLRWKIAYKAWQAGKMLTLFVGYLTAMQLILGTFGGPHDFLIDYNLWIKETGKIALLSLASEGMWQLYDANSRRDQLRMNWMENRNNIAIGKARAVGILLKSQYLAISVAVMSVMAKILYLGGDEFYHPRILIALGSAAGLTYIFRTSKVRKFIGRIFSYTWGCGRGFLGL